MGKKLLQLVERTLLRSRRLQAKLRSDSLQQGRIARLIGVIHDSNGEPLIAKSLPQLVQMPLALS